MALLLLSLTKLDIPPKPIHLRLDAQIKQDAWHAHRAMQCISHSPLVRL